ncbi:hypothetical protein C7S18_01565 [Ahniella affigens]|uniref:Trm112 family protein n=1 Tax=Ahniella affigens TaxID=2021234 RepID=A0A2P1PYQ0_9GAMM|nr:hypothetical protein C7S18_01565 [Ahniella affigens]
MDARFVSTLICPVKKLPLRTATKSQLAFLNREIAQGTALMVNGHQLTEPVSDALIREDGDVLYRISDGIPVLLPEEGIGTLQFTDFPK